MRTRRPVDAAAACVLTAVACGLALTLAPCDAPGRGAAVDTPGRGVAGDAPGGSGVADPPYQWAAGDARSRSVPGGSVGPYGSACSAWGRGMPCGTGMAAVPPDAWAAVVARVVDGDTVILRVRGRNVRVRLIGVDAPETWLRRDCFGSEAVSALRRILPSESPVRAAGDVEPYDRYRRRLLYLWTAGGVFVDGALVRAGFARAMVVPPDTRYSMPLREAEQEAMRRKAGLWNACP